MSYVCTICGYIFDESKGILWADLPEEWVCPLCGADKSAFVVKEEVASTEAVETSVPVNDASRSLKVEEMAALASNLAKGCEKQYFPAESQAFKEIEAYYNGQRQKGQLSSIKEMLAVLDEDINVKLLEANGVIDGLSDRGSKRALVWAEKVTRMTKSLMAKYEAEGDAFIENKKVYVCEICGFMYVGDDLPDVCPVCKVPNFKMTEVGRD